MGGSKYNFIIFCIQKNSAHFPSPNSSQPTHPTLDTLSHTASAPRSPPTFYNTADLHHAGRQSERGESLFSPAGCLLLLPVLPFVVIMSCLHHLRRWLPSGMLPKTPTWTKHTRLARNDSPRRTLVAPRALRWSRHTAERACGRDSRRRSVYLFRWSGFSSRGDDGTITFSPIIFARASLPSNDHLLVVLSSTERFRQEQRQQLRGELSYSTRHHRHNESTADAVCRCSVMVYIALLMILSTTGRLGVAVKNFIP